ncbi:MAG TPA: hypothetical protein VNE39_12335 [Planctomycetota bacterium]|nr:hypothetical protein [Planctomycetota bacterium]
MRVRPWAVFLLACVLLGEVVAMSIGVGLDWRTGLFVQEYWQGGKPRYLIANLTREAARVSVQSYQMPDMREGRLREQAPPPRKPVETLAGPWEVPASGVADVDASALLGKGLVEFRAGDKRLGLLEAPKALPAEPSGGIATTYGINGSGGRQARMWCEHQALRIAAGADLEVKLVTATDQGTIKFSRKAKPGADSRPAELPLREAACDTLTIASTADAVVIDTAKPLKDQPWHTVVLRLKAPDASAATLVTFGGWVQHKGGGYWLIRGLVVEPRAAK